MKGDSTVSEGTIDFTEWQERRLLLLMNITNVESENE